jgi:Intracellular proteinase inhibitor
MSVSRFVILLVVAACAVASAPAQDSVVPVIPKEESPFFVLNDASLNPGEGARKKLTGPQYDFPRNKTAEVSAGKMFTSFFTDMFSSVQIGTKPSSGSKLAVEPSKFSLDDRREVTVTFTVENRTNKLVKMDFPTSQRIEILVHDPSGKVIDKWSDDHAFQDISGVVMINPGEHIEYEQRISTRDMQPAQTYTIEASLANNPEFTKTVTVTPTGKPREVKPNPVLQSTPPAQ